MDKDNISNKEIKEGDAIFFGKAVPAKEVIDWFHDMWGIKDKDK